MEEEKLRGDKPRKVLIVEDSPPYLEQLSKIFEGNKIAFVTATSLEQVQAALAEGSVTEVLTDSLTGHWPDVLKNAKDLNLPVRLLTVASDRGLIRMAERLGVKYLDKFRLNKEELIKDPRVQRGTSESE